MVLISLALLYLPLVALPITFVSSSLYSPLYTTTISLSSLAITLLRIDSI